MQDISKYLSVSERDYTALAGSDWPSYDNFIQHYNVPEFVYREIDQVLNRIEKFNNKAFCVLPFYGMEYPLNKECCLMVPSSDSIEAVRQKMINGERPTSCQQCWHLEDNGLISDRIIKNNHLDFILDKDLKLLEEECKTGNFSELHYKVDTNNTCNATCVTCDGGSSTSWIKLENKQGIRINKPWKLSIDQIKINYKTAKSINFRGGESLLSKTNFDILETLIKNKNTECFVSFTTNGSISLTDKQISILSKFKKKNFCLSIDGVDKIFEYLRYPIKWNTILSNIDQYKQNNIILSVSFTLSNLNMLYYSQIINWFNENGIPYLNNVVSQPDYFRPTSLPKDIKDKIIDKNNSIFLASHSDNDDLLFNNFLAKIHEQDKIKKIKMKNYIPEFYELIKNYIKDDK